MNGSDYIYLARTQAGLTQAELGVRVGRAQTEIARLEGGRSKTSFETVRDIIRACGLELEISFARADDSYVADIERRLDGSPAERIARGLRQARQAQQLQRATLVRTGA